LAKNYHSNRYQYGLTSAGVFVYAYNSDKLIQQFTLVPSQNITMSNQGAPISSLLSKKGDALIRPVSDDRGFEVVGQYRYGRGVSLRDGSLILGVPGSANSKANVSTQVALSGGVFETLNAQSQGLTTVSTGAPNAAYTMATLVPEDLQTAGTITPNKGSETAQFSSTNTNFISSAPLGSPAQAGVPASVEASQLSRALTLAEMSVAEDSSGDADCACLVGRGDLAFINQGYVVKTLTNAAAPTSISDDSNSAFSNQSTPAVLKFDQMQSRVESFMFDLFKSLDQDHYQFEQALRGNLLPQTQSEASTPVDLFNPSTPGQVATRPLLLGLWVERHSVIRLPSPFRPIPIRMGWRRASRTSAINSKANRRASQRRQTYNKLNKN